MSTKNPEEKKKKNEKKQTKTATKTKKGSRATTSKKNKKKEEEEVRIERMPVKTRPKKTKKTEIDKEKETSTPDQKEKKVAATKKTTRKVTEKKKTTKAIPKEWKQPTKEKKRTTEKKKRKSLISTLKRSISTKKPLKEEKEIMAPMNIVVTLNPIKHADIIEYIEEHISSGGRAEWVRDSIRLKMRVEEGVYGLDAGGQSGAQRDTETMMQSVFGRFAEVMTQVMREIRTEQPATKAPARPRPAPRAERTGEPPQLKKIDGGIVEAVKPDRPALDDAIGAIVVVE